MTSRVDLCRGHRVSQSADRQPARGYVGAAIAPLSQRLALPALCRLFVPLVKARGLLTSQSVGQHPRHDLVLYFSPSVLIVAPPDSLGQFVYSRCTGSREEMGDLAPGTEGEEADLISVSCDVFVDKYDLLVLY